MYVLQYLDSYDYIEACFLKRDQEIYNFMSFILIYS